VFRRDGAVREAEWRGSPRATMRSEFMRLLGVLHPSKNTDVFYDLGCGYARPCIWIALKVKLAVGIENHYYRYQRALKEVEKAGFTNIKILREDINEASYHDMTIAYSVISIGFEVIARIQKQAKPGAVIVLYGLPPYPIKSEKLFGKYFRMRTPLTRVKDEDEFARIFLGRKGATLKDLYSKLDHDEVKDLKREIRQADSNWIKLRRSS